MCVCGGGGGGDHSDEERHSDTFQLINLIFSQIIPQEKGFTRNQY